MAQTPLQPLSVGNVVSAAFRLYRDRLSTYLGIAIRASLWALLPLVAILPIPFLILFGQVDLSILWIAIPIGFLLFMFGSAKYTTNLALISRLAFGVLADKPETVQEASSHVIPKVWRFWLASFLTFWIVFGVYVGLCLAIGIGVAIGSFIVNNSQGNVLVLSTLSILAIIALAMALIFFLRFIIRFTLVEVPLAIENNLTASQTIDRSRKLTQGNVDRIFWIWTVAGLITLPIQLIANILASSIQNILIGAISVDPTSPTFQIIIFLMSYIIGLILSVFLVPFWQAIKATIYYDLRTRKEGLDLQLRDR
jgi:hypothetical protein